MTKKIKVALAQINNSFSGQNYLPYSTALLESYVLKNSLRAEQYEFIDTIYKRIPIVEIVSRMSSAQVVGFSMYVWNEQITLESIRRLKKQNPEIFIVVGGPQVPSEPQKFLKDNPQSELHNIGESADWYQNGHKLSGQVDYVPSVNETIQTVLGDKQTG